MAKPKKRKIKRLSNEECNAFGQGYTAHEDRILPRGCPYLKVSKLDHVLTSAWLKGWSAAFNDHQGAWQ